MKNKIDTIIKKIIKNSNIVGIAIVGSYQKEKKFNDIDFLVVCENIKIAKNHLNNIFKDYKIIYNDDCIRISGYLNCEISFGIYNKKNLMKRINNYINGKNLEPIYKNWNIVGWLPECLLNDLNEMSILYEEGEFLTKIKSIIYNYPEKMQKAIIKLCDEKINNLKKSNNCGSIEKKIIDSEILSLRIRKAFAEKKKYLSGYKRIDQKICDIKVNFDE